MILDAPSYQIQRVRVIFIIADNICQTDELATLRLTLSGAQIKSIYVLII